jgi:glycosyltransferase involved in cell wall biosynthesis
METIPDPRVAFLASTLVTGGAERVVETLARGLPRRGLETRVFCLRAPGEVGRALASDGVAVESGIARFRRDPLAAAPLAAALRAWRPSVLVSLDHHDAMWAAPAAAALAGVRRLVLMVHSTGLWGKRGTFSRMDRLVLPSYDRIVALARSHAEYLVRRERVNARRIAIVANGVDTERFRPAGSEESRRRFRESIGVPAGDFVVAIVAALRPEKNHAMFLRSAARMRERRDGVSFLVVGEGREEEGLRALARGLSLGGAVRFLGRREDVPCVLAASDALALTSHPVVETLPLVVLEGMAAGLPVAATDVGSVREMLVDGEEGFIVSSNDDAALAEKLLFLASSPEAGRRMGERARERVVREFNVDGMISGYETLVRELARRGE